MRRLKTLLGALVLLIAGTASAQMPAGEYLDGGNSKVAVILAHGQGLAPDGNVVGPLRRSLHRELAIHTLSLSMPTLPGAKSLDQFEEYVSTFPDAYKRIQAAIDFLSKEKGATRIYLMGHSMGGRMTSAFLANNPEAPVVGFIGVGLLAGGKEPLNTNLNLRKVRVPVIDIYAENDRDARAAEFRRSLVSERFTQVSVPGATHDYRGHEKFVAEAVIGWIRKQEGN
jgi:predicted alpha/beta-hydrolase family hydrolase